MAQSVISEAKVPAAEQNDFVSVFRRNIHDAIVMTRRNLIHYVRLPQLLVFSTIQPIMFVLLFAYVFGGSIQIPGFDYIDYLLPGILVQTVLFGGSATTVGLADDLSKGLIDRFRSLPMARSAVLAGRTLADTVRNFLVVLLMIGVGTLIGFRYHDGLMNMILAVLLVVLFGHAMSWIFALVGILVKDPETAQVAGFVWVFPLVFASSVFVRTDTMPDWLQVFAENQPISLVANAARGLILGTSTSDFIPALIWIVAIWIVFAFLAVRQYRRTV
jgi:ABC transporter DrrB family efflux protein